MGRKGHRKSHYTSRQTSSEKDKITENTQNPSQQSKPNNKYSKYYNNSSGNSLLLQHSPGDRSKTALQLSSTNKRIPLRNKTTVVTGRGGRL